MHIAVIGTGYVGLVTGVCLAEIGHTVRCIDIDEAKISRLRAGDVPIYEPGLQEMMQRTAETGRLTFTTDLAEDIGGAEAIFLALPTPQGADGAADLSAVLQVADQLGEILQDYTVIIDKSTVPVGTGAEVSKRIAAKTSAEFDVVSNPEFLREGAAVKDFMHPDRIIIGTGSDRARTVMKRIYEPLDTNSDLIVWMDVGGAEMTKYAANSFLAMKVSYMNEIANLCDKLGVNVDDVRRGIGRDERIGNRFLYPGIGYGGSCFPKDVQALFHTAGENGYDFRLLRSILEVNAAQKHRLVEKAAEYYGGNLRGKHFALWGLAFKPDTDDIREAPAVDMIESLLQAGATVTAYDPEAMDNTRRYLGDKEGLTYAADQLAACQGADALFIATEWSQFRNPDFEQIRSTLKSPVIFDGRNMYDPADMTQLGFHYESIGRPHGTA